jgi:hypothetical protein
MKRLQERVRTHWFATSFGGALIFSSQFLFLAMLTLWYARFVPALILVPSILVGISSFCGFILLTLAIFPAVSNWKARIIIAASILSLVSLYTFSLLPILEPLFSILVLVGMSVMYGMLIAGATLGLLGGLRMFRKVRESEVTES